MKPKSLTVKYFASLKDKSGMPSEKIEAVANSPRELFTLLDSRYHFEMNPDFIRVAVNDEFREWNHPLTTGDEVVFMTPVAGG